jgi:hydroxymethylpyrimidine kinase/phosphomethylpyrimidine kinase
VTVHPEVHAVRRPVALTIAGSDSGGGAGIQADLATFTACGVFGTSVLTCVTAQNLEGVRGVVALSPADVMAQLDAVLDGFPVAAAKTGMLFSRDIVLAVAEAARRPGFPPLVVDPVMVATSGARLLNDDAVAAYVERLLPRAAVATPNLDEAAVLLGRAIRHADEMPGAARELADRLGCPVFLKGGHLDGDRLVDVLWDGAALHSWTGLRVSGVIPHGTGCRLSAALAARLALGDTLPEAARVAREVVARALTHATELTDGRRVAGWGGQDRNSA